MKLIVERVQFMHCSNVLRFFVFDVDSNHKESSGEVSQFLLTVLIALRKGVLD